MIIGVSNTDKVLTFIRKVVHFLFFVLSYCNAFLSTMLPGVHLPLVDIRGIRSRFWVDFK